MAYLTLKFYIFLAVIIGAYYALPLNRRYFALLLGSAVFYIYTAKFGAVILFIAAIVTYFAALKIKGSRTVLVFSVTYALSLLLIIKYAPFGIVSALGISFYTLQIIAYLADVYRGKCEPQKDFLKYLLFISFFPQIVQGPIPRYGDLAPQLYEGHKFSEQGFTKGTVLIGWGFFLKLMVADKAAVIADTVFAAPWDFSGAVILTAGILYSLQLYADFKACTCISRGISEIFGIRLSKNFNSPYAAVSVKDFWRRWHMTLSSFLRDYVYIPLGGSREGTAKKYRNILITFAVSGFWHGVGIKYVVWGLIHGTYQIAEDFIFPKGKDGNLSGFRRALSVIFTFTLVMFAWIIFRADTLPRGLYMIYSIFTRFDVASLFGGGLFTLGLVKKEATVLIFALLIQHIIEAFGDRTDMRGLLISLPLPVRWFIYIGAILIIWIFGTYGFGFSAADFIYRGF